MQTLMLKNIAKMNDVEIAIQILIREWDSLVIPRADEIFQANLEDSPGTSDYSDVISIKNWLSGKIYSKIADHPSFEIEMPFIYLTPYSSIYYMGGYMLEMLTGLHDEGEGYIAGFPEVQLMFYMGRVRILSDLERFEDGVKSVISKFYYILLKESLMKRYYIPDAEIECAKRNYLQLTADN